MAKRKAVGKRKRFEVFKRDDFTCGYCGQRPPAVILEVDHIEAVSSGGDNQMANLITACRDCNRGKSDVSLTRITRPIAANSEDERERQAQVNALRRTLRATKKAEREQIAVVADGFRELCPGAELSTTFKLGTIKLFLQHFTGEEMLDFFEMAVGRLGNSNNNNVVKYFCGICWNKIHQREEGRVQP